MDAPRPRAVALQYTAGHDPAPRVTARGQRHVAEQIIAAAQQAGIPVHSDPDLVDLLLQFDLDQCLPPHLYEVVAEMLAFLYRVDLEWRARHGLPTSPPETPAT